MTTGKKSIFRFRTGLIICLILTAAACRNNSEIIDPQGVLIEYSGCKEPVSLSSGYADSPMNQETGDCLVYSYDGENTLKLTHMNAGFNCCPGRITASIDISGNLISIYEEEQEQACLCLCLYDLEYEIIGLKPGEYIVRLFGPHVNENNGVWDISLELFTPTQGTQCIDRGYYPWQR